MKVGGVPYRAIFTAGDGVPVGHAVPAGDAGTAGDAMDVWVIDQTVLPHRFETLRLESVDDAVHAIRDMVVRGAPLIGATAAYGVALAMRADPSDASLEEALAGLGEPARPRSTWSGRSTVPGRCCAGCRRRSAPTRPAISPPASVKKTCAPTGASAGTVSKSSRRLPARPERPRAGPDANSTS